MVGDIRGLELDEKYDPVGRVDFSYVEKEGNGQKVERYQLTDDLGIIFTGERFWKTEEISRLLGLITREETTYEEDVQRRISYDSRMQSVITEKSSWQEFYEALEGTDAEDLISTRQ